MPRHYPRSLAAVLLAGLLAVFAAGCEISFSVTEELPVQTIAGNPLGGLIPDMSWSIDITSQQEYQSRNFERIKELWIRDLVLEIQPNTEGTFDFITSVQVLIRATIDGTPQEEVVAWIPNGDSQLNSGQRSIRFQTTNVNILPFIQAESGYTARVVYEGQRPPEDIDVGGTLQYRLKVEL